MRPRALLHLASGALLGGVVLAVSPAGAEAGRAPATPTLASPTPATVTPATLALGERLFADPRLSPDGRFSCASCHRPDAAFAEPGSAQSRGRDGLPLAVNTPSLLGRDHRGPFRHDGAAATLQAQVALALLAKDEMANPSLAAMAARLAEDPLVEADFVGAFGRAPTGVDVVAALAAHVRSLRVGDTPFDAWLRGDASALSPAALRGLALFRGEAGCAACHLIGGEMPRLRDGRFHDTGIAARRAGRPHPAGIRPTEGRMAVTGRAADRFRIRTPSLWGVAATPPYMHDGSIRTLEGVVRYYAAGGARHAGLSPLVAPFDATDGDVADLGAFLEALGPPAAGTAVSADPAE